jgi:hypothetical protein
MSVERDKVLWKCPIGVSIHVVIMHISTVFNVDREIRS